jgi:hypothetical protein
MDFYAPVTPSEEDPEEVEPHVSVDEQVLGALLPHIGCRVVARSTPFALGVLYGSAETIWYVLHETLWYVC